MYLFENQKRAVQIGERVGYLNSPLTGQINKN